jgi:hypothetical protein
LKFTAAESIGGYSCAAGGSLFPLVTRRRGGAMLQLPLLVEFINGNR